MCFMLEFYLSETKFTLLAALKVFKVTGIHKLTKFKVVKHLADQKTHMIDKNFSAVLFV